MGSLELITKDESTAAYASAVALAKDLLGPDVGYLSANAKLGTLSDWEWNKLAVAVVSGWIRERSRQLVADRVWKEGHFLATGEVPEAVDLGTAATALPALGDLVEKLGIGELPVGSWSKDQILMFVWSAFDLVREAQSCRDGRPGPMEIGEIAGATVMSG